MNIEELREYCLNKKGVIEDFPFGEETLVFKVGDKIFLLTGLEEAERFNAKCDPERAIELRAEHEEVIPGWHMNKKHWNTVYMNGRLTNKQIKEIIDHSYQLVFDGLPRKIKEEIKTLS
jgi:predicted DNA-binding protein (MmcQ/YjbR family)